MGAKHGGEHSRSGEYLDLCIRYMLGMQYHMLVDYGPTIFEADAARCSVGRPRYHSPIANRCSHLPNSCPRKMHFPRAWNIYNVMSPIISCLLMLALMSLGRTKRLAEYNR